MAIKVDDPNVREMLVAYRLRGDEIYPATLLGDPTWGAVDLLFFHPKMSGKIVHKEKVKRGFDVGCWETFPNMTNHLKCAAVLSGDAETNS
jgi:hypothetical protein